MTEIENKIAYIEIIAKDIVDELKKFDLECITYSSQGIIPFQSQHRARFNRLRIELNKKCLELETIFKSGRYE